MRDTTRQGKDPKHSQEMLQVLLDLTRFSRQATASEALETKALELLHYLLARCQASRGAIVLLDPPQQVKISFRPLALEHIQEAEIRALLTPGGAFPAQLSQVPGETHWLLLRLPLFQADLTMAFTPICQSAEISTHLPGSAFLILGWTTKKSQKHQPMLAHRSALVAQIGDALSAILMHLVLVDYLARHQMLVKVPEGEATRVSPTMMHEWSEADEELLLAICDHGIGIPTQQQEQIFQQFVRAENARVYGIEGIGLGLYLCRILIERHGGRIWCESVEGQGSTFFVAFPSEADGKSFIE